MSAHVQKPSHYFSVPRREMLSFVPENVRRVLEIGCGEGRFGSELKHSRAIGGVEVEVVGVEIDSARADVAKACLDKVFVGDVERDDLNLELASFDCIIFNDVLEHLIAPWRVLKEMRELLVPGGYVVASIPNVRYLGVLKSLLIEADWRYAGEGVLDVTHLRFFTRKSIVRLFEEQGYEVQVLTGINSLVSGWKFSLLKMLSNGHFNDTQFLQFAIVARLPS